VQGKHNQFLEVHHQFTSIASASLTSAKMQQILIYQGLPMKQFVLNDFRHSELCSAVRVNWAD